MQSYNFGSLDLTELCLKWYLINYCYDFNGLLRLQYDDSIFIVLASLPVVVFDCF